MKYEPIDIKCPDCGELAKFEEPFEFLSKKVAPPDATKPTHQWGGWTVLERFPSQVSWKVPSGSSQYLRGGGDASKGGYPLLMNGLAQCSHCYSNRKHKLNWPSDAYWQWEVRGELLWAWDKEHAQVILNFVKETSRPSRHSYSLKYIPSHFLSAKARDLVVKKMERSINV
ncbi:hypothetical protein PRUB_a0670 [Pseudoalteromonas rubra]|uniref:Uncharacterized protein n=1 Tax=Pseudoalteromonas rubra TaxID=43658 RepID=A0A8T0C671_9GAMM|nr:hypothetical protein [Pseudoalteromonas rubra]KAF7786189.1 hypothetical protein PRUB_a0670 [Pseudoalteromonas rubra]